MNKILLSTIRNIFFSICLVSLLGVSASAEEYQALKGVESVKTIFDFRDGLPDNALVHLTLVHETYKDQAVTNVSQKPEFVVVFMDSSVLLLSSDRDKFSDEERGHLEKLDKVISASSKDGIRLEVCMYAVEIFGVDPESISKEIHRVGNGWISSLGYQQKGFSLVPAY